MSTKRLDLGTAQAALRLSYAEVARLLRQRRPLPQPHFDACQRPVHLPTPAELRRFRRERRAIFHYARLGGVPARPSIGAPGADEAVCAGRIAAALRVRYRQALDRVRHL
jgi:hypothetical protein